MSAALFAAGRLGPALSASVGFARKRSSTAAALAMGLGL